MKIYIAGAISGLHNANKEQFAETEKLLLENGHTTINPHKIPHKDINNWGQCMKEDIPEMLKCDAVFLMHGWKHSKGAKIEKDLAEVLGIKLMNYMEETNVIK